MEFQAHSIEPVTSVPVPVRLHLLVSEGDLEICKVELGSGASESLQDLFPPHIITGLKEQGVSFEKQQELASEYLVSLPQKRRFYLIDNQIGLRRYEVWLE